MAAIILRFHAEDDDFSLSSQLFKATGFQPVVVYFEDFYVVLSKNFNVVRNACVDLCGKCLYFGFDSGIP